MTDSRTAILLFSRTASAEAERKSFGGGPADRRVADALISRTEETLARTGLKVFRSDEVSQRGATFGERLTNAMAEVFSQGIERLLVVGNDCPQITAQHLRSAAQKLAAGENVIGPDRRGGVWLIGLLRENFDAAALAALPWETDRLFAELDAALPAHATAGSLNDLNSFEDLRGQWFLLRRQISELFDLLLLSEAAFGPRADELQPAVITRRLGRAPPR